VPTVARIIPITNDGQQKLTNTPYDFQSPMVTDGARIFFEEQRATHSAIAEVSTSGGDTELLKTPFRSAQLAAVSPDHSQLLLADMYSETATEMPFYNLPVIGGTAQRIGDLLAHDAAWSPSGEWMVFARKDELILTKPDGTPVRKLVAGMGLPWWPRWSPDGKKLRFTISDPRTQANSIWEVFPDGSNLRPLVTAEDGPPTECCGTWTHDGRYFVFQAIRDNNAAVWMSSERNSGFRSKQDSIRLTTGPMQTYAPLPSIDDKTVYVIGAKHRSELVRYNFRTKTFVPFLTGLSASEVEFSKDGQSIIYVNYPEGTLWRAKADGSSRVQLTSVPFTVWLPRWSPDGTQITFFGGMPGKPWKVYVIPATGGTPESVWPETLNQGDPNWSPDGNSLVFGRLPWKTGATEPCAIYILDLKTRRLSQVEGSEGLFSPRWSPDGKYLMAMKPDSTQILLYSFDLHKWTTVARGLLNYASWSGDSKYIYAMDSHLPGVTTWVRIRVGDGKVDTVADLSTVRQIVTAWIGLDADESPIVAREIGTEEIYALQLTTP
jgi:Tol biopolymer transport system component